ncbi:Adenylate cyclase [Acidisarcina polymorpha]|uniref:Adenylate cyclase n=1 Tax=Acidisarcina polymorpha TaxID=2211140 RepID=A0A2Z5G1A6_9BACT|nr:malectin domain-containing carbohydrate-binding protein [Acidisarcina polymorpha]AXC12584.1 Adenylate cyclase [Acidisarcina polymorpha]
MSSTYSEPRVKEDEERSELQAVLQSGILKRAPNLQHFLEFVAEEYFAGTADQVKEYSIAVQALHRPEKFDPQSDTIVRVTAHALRKKLEQYYATDGAAHEVQIQLPAGKYVLQFVRKEPELPIVQPSVTFGPPDVIQETAPVADRKSGVWVAFAIVLVVLLAGSVIIFFLKQRQALPPSKAASASVVSEADSLMRIRFGSSTTPYVDAAGQSWINEHYCKGGTTFNHSGHDIQGTDDLAIFREGRKGKFQCRIPVAPGIYKLQLLFADTAGDKVGAGQVDYTINDRISEALDVVDEAGGSDIALGKVYEGIRPMSDGTIHLDFRSEDAFANALELTRTDSEVGPPLRMLAGPAVFHDDSGNVWLPERFFLGGRRASHSDTLPKIANAGLYGWERYGHFRYMLPVVPGREYTVRMYFFEEWFGAKNGGPGGVGSRVFDVYCNGMTLLTNFDISKESSSGTITMTIRHVKPTAHGTLELNFTPVTNYPLVNAIEVDPEG